MKVSSALLAAPVALAAGTQMPRSKPYPQESLEQYNILRYTGATGPYVSSTGFGIDTETPEYCTVTQAHLFMRHGARYPTTSTGASELEIYQKLMNATENMSVIEGPLSFLKDYTFFVGDSSRLETESNAGYYAGLTECFDTGALLRQKYDHLFDGETIHPVFAGSQERVVNSAQAFGKGFFGLNYTDLCSIQVIPETAEQGANTLTATEACANLNESVHEDIYDAFPSDYLDNAAFRLNTLSPGFNITGDDVYDMMGYCGFELNVRGYSPMCDLFTLDEWLTFEYTKSVDYYYQNGPGYNLSAAIGSVYANSTYTLMEQGSDYPYNLTFSFSHDTDIVFYAAALGLYEPDYDLDATQVDFLTNYRATQICPMGGRLVTERMECMDPSTNKTGIYARVILNDAVVPIPGCQEGPSFSCPLDGYLETIQNNLSMNQTYTKACGVNSTYPQYTTFYWDWEVTFDDN